MKKFCLGSLAFSLIQCTKPKINQNRPNILFLFTDDQRFNNINALNNPAVKTPNMDRLVRNGVSFSRAHIMGGTSGAVCMPSRAMLMTGKTLFHLQNRGATIPEEHALMPETFKNMGYTTFGTGKWHNGRRAYARSFTQGGKIMFGGMSDHLKVPVNDFDPTGQYPKSKTYKASKFSSELFSDEATNFLKEYQSDDPFFMYISYTAPHDPRMAPKEFADLYPPEKIELPENFMQQHPFNNGEMKIRDERLAPWPRTSEVIQEHIAAYYAMISHLDHHLGRILAALEKSGKAENTVIVLAGDNGLAVGQHGLLGKQNLYEHSVRVPLVISGTGIPKNVKTDALCYLLDLYPTLCEIADIPIPDSVEGQTLLPALKNQQAKIRNALFLAYTKIQRAVRTDKNWKLIRYNVHGVQTTQLFNLNRDPWELKNLSADPKFKNEADSLIQLLKKYSRELDDFCDLYQPNWGLPDEVYKPKQAKHLAKGKKVILQNLAQIKYSNTGLSALTDGMRGTDDFRDGYWIGIEATDLEVVIDLEQPQLVKKISIAFLEDQGSWIFWPSSVEFSRSPDGKKYELMKKTKHFQAVPNQFKKIKNISAQSDAITTRFIKIKAKSLSKCPDWHQGYGGKAWLFADEIVVK